MGFRGSSLLFIALLLACSSAVYAFDITKLLGENPEFSTFNKYLTETKLAEQINSRNAITVLVVDNNAISSIAGKSPEVIKAIISTHVILDFFDEKKLMEAVGSGEQMATLFQASGLAVNNQGFIKVSLVGEGEFAFGSAVSGAPVDAAELMSTIHSEPNTISILQVTMPIIAPGVDSSSPGAKLIPMLAQGAQAPMPAQGAKAHIPSVSAKAPIAAQSAKAPIAAPSTKSSTATTQSSHTPVVTAESAKASTAATESVKTPVPAQSPKTSTSAQNVKTPAIAAESAKAPAAAESAKPSIAARSPETPAATENVKTPVLAQSPKTSTTTESVKTPTVAAESAKAPIAAKSVKTESTPVATESVKTPVLAQSPKTLTAVESAKTLVAAAERAIAPTTAQSFKSPVLAQSPNILAAVESAKTLVATAENAKAPISAQATKSPVPVQSFKAPAPAKESVAASPLDAAEAPITNPIEDEFEGPDVAPADAPAYSSASSIKMGFVGAVMAFTSFILL